MASTSASFVQKSFKYDVFLSFRGDDTRKNFVDHLYHALEQKGIETYKDDEKIRKGKTISDELIEAIEDSRFYIIVFSKNYASSSWCLEELVKIMECEKMTEHIAYPVFYDVEPTEVRKLYGPVGEAFKKHEKEESAGKWREALKEAAALAGWELKTTANGHEANFTQRIIQDISLELRFINSSVDGNLVGMETRVNEVISSLETGVDDVRMVGIKGMGGAGKTTLARAVFDKISFQFEGQCFVENIREESKPSLSGLKSLQKQVLTDVLNNQGITVNGVHEGKKMIQKKMHVRKVLIVLDDVDKIEQLEALVGEGNWYKPGSRIIITTRDEQVLVAHKVCLIQNVNLLSTEEAICLFSRYAFGKDVPVPGYEELSGLVVRYAAGLPLTIKVLGSFLCGKNDLDWKDAIERLKTIPLKETLDKLELSYKGLEEDYKEIFLDVACILKGWPKDDAVIALESCGFHARNGLRVLEQRSLMNISEDGYLEMHDHIEEMGMNIVRRVNPNKPERHSRLWIDEEIEDILANDLATQETKCITMFAEESNLKILMNGLTNMKELRFLQVDTEYVSEDEVCNWGFDEVSLHLPKSLRFLRWLGYPFSSLPKTFQAKKLVGLEMAFGNLVQLWKDGEEKVEIWLINWFLDFTNLQLRTLDLSVAPNLETLILHSCYNLVEVHFQFPAECPKLVDLKLNNLKLPTLYLGITPNLEELKVNDCTDMVELRMPVEFPKLVDLDLSNLKLTSLHLGITPKLETLSLKDCCNLVELHLPFRCLKLKNLSLIGLSLRNLHLGMTPDLETLSLVGCDSLVELHMHFERPKLKFLSLRITNTTRKSRTGDQVDVDSLLGLPLSIINIQQFGILRNLILGDVVLRRSHKPHSFGKLYYACPRSKDEITFENASSFSRPTTPSNSSLRASSSSGSSRAALSPGNTECSNRKLLTMKIKILEARLAMEKNPDDHPCESAAILHELLNEMENFRVE
ncbi:Toll/interleukin-1 receptor domain-containing protein [Tanacetum coccineum]